VSNRVAIFLVCVIALLILTVGSRIEDVVHRIFDKNHTGAGFSPPPSQPPPGTTP